MPSDPPLRQNDDCFGAARSIDNLVISSPAAKMAAAGVSGCKRPLREQPRMGTLGLVCAPIVDVGMLTAE
jgi:hypothetical protein